MTRPSYSIDIPASVHSQWTDGTHQADNFPPDGEHSEETVSGVSRRKPTGWIPPTGYNMVHRRYRRAFGSCRATFAPPFDFIPGTEYSGCVGGAGGRFNSLGHFDELCLETFSPSGLENGSLIAARNNLKSQKVNLGNAFGERKQVAYQLGDTATRIARAVRQLRRGEITNAMRSLGLKANRGKPRGSNIPEQWLALQYGWKPLLSDIYGAADALSKRPKSDWRVTAKGTKRQKDVFTKTWTNVDYGFGSAEVDSRAMTRIDCLPQNEAIISLSSLGITNPLEVAWELTPWSFVVDWVYPIGDWLNSLDAMLGYSNAYTSTTYLQKFRWVEDGRSGTVSGTIYKNDYHGSKYVVKLTRTASSGVPMPTLPPLKDGRSLGHMANGLALLAQAFGRSPRPGIPGPTRNYGKLFLARYGTV